MLKIALQSLLFLSALAAQAKCAEITTTPIPTGGTVVHIDGDITLGDEKTFSALKISDPNKSLVWLTSVGGSLVVAFQIGRQIKELGLTTVVNTNGPCASSCTMIRMAGRHAIVERNSQLIFHEPSNVQSPDKPDQRAINATVAYLMDVAGLNEQQALALATAAPPSDGWAATEAAARALGFRPQVVPFAGAARACQEKFCLAVRRYAGIGVRLIVDNDRIKVAEVFAGSPAERAQVKADDVITHIDNETVKELTREQILNRIRGPADTKVILTLLRKGQDKPFDLAITREVVPMQSEQH
jgi:hypothetical protein